MSNSPFSAKRFFSDPVGYANRHGWSDRRAIRMRGGVDPQILVRDREEIWELLVERPYEFRPGKWKQRIARFMGPALNTLNGEAHRRRRELMQPTFSGPRMKPLAPNAATHVLEWQAGWCDGDHFDLLEWLDPMVLTLAGRVLFSCDLNDGAGEVSRDLRLVVEAAPRLTRPFRVTPQGKALERLNRLADRMIDERSGATEPSDGLIDRMLAAGEDRNLIRGEVVFTLTGVIGEIPFALESAWWLLDQHPEVAKRLTEECCGTSGMLTAGSLDPGDMPYLAAFMNEALRVNPPVRFIDRCPVGGSRQLGDSRIGSRANLLVSPLVTHRDPQVFPEPDEFRPERMIREDGRAVGHGRGTFIPFGLGPHACLGAPFARMSIGATLAVTAGKWHLRVDDDAPAPLPGSDGFGVTLGAVDCP